MSPLVFASFQENPWTHLWKWISQNHLPPSAQKRATLLFFFPNAPSSFLQKSREVYPVAEWNRRKGDILPWAQDYKLHMV